VSRVQHLDLLIHHASNPQPLTASRSALSTAPSLQQPLGQLHSRTQHSARTAVSDGIIDRMNSCNFALTGAAVLIRLVLIDSILHTPHSSLATLGFVASLPSDAALRSCRNLFTRGVALWRTLTLYPRPYAAVRAAGQRISPGGGGSTGRREPNGVDRRVPPVTKVSAVPVALCHAGPDCRCRVARVRHARVRRPVTRAGGRGPVSPP
jgi:hypothetical protein